MIRRDRTGREPRVAAVPRALGATTLIRVLLLAAIATVAWMLGSASAGADVLDVVEDSGSTVSDASDTARRVPAEVTRKTADAVTSGHRPDRDLTVPATPKAPKAPKVDAFPIPVVKAPKAPEGVSEVPDLSGVADKATGRVRDAVAPVTDRADGDNGDTDTGPDARTERAPHRSAADRDAHRASDRRTESKAAVDTAARLGDLTRSAGHGGADDGRRVVATGSTDWDHSDDRGHGPVPMSGQSQAAGSPTAPVAGYLTVVPTPYRNGASTRVERSASTPVPQRAADDRAFSPD